MPSVFCFSYSVELLLINILSFCWSESAFISFSVWRLFLLDTEFQDNIFFFPFSNLKMPFHQFFFSASIVFDKTLIILILVPLCISIVYTFSLDPLKYFLLNFRFLKFDRKVPGCGFLLYFWEFAKLLGYGS